MGIPFIRLSALAGPLLAVAGGPAAAAPEIVLSQPAFVVGDRLQLTITAGEPCWLWIVSVTPPDAVVLLVPNGIDQRIPTQLEPGVPFQFPAAGGGYELAMADVTTEEIYALCAAEEYPEFYPEWEDGSPFVDLAGTGLGQALLALDPSDPEVPIEGVKSWSRVSFEVRDPLDTPTR